MANPVMEISGRKIGYDYDPLVVAEIGINHEGSLQTAMEMVDAAVSAGAEVIKHQTHICEDEMSVHAKSVIPGNADVSIYEIMNRCSLSENEEIELKKYVEKKGAIFISTPFSRKAALRLKKMDVVAYKIGSGECNNYPLVKLIAGFGKPVIMSTGMNSIKSVEKSVEILERAGVQYALLHCTNIYPTPDELIRLGGLEKLIEAFPRAVVGLSDHSLDNLACLASVALGASILERHFTDHKNRPGPDIINSMTPKECSELIKQSSRIKKMRGGLKCAAEEEGETITFAFASVVAIRDIAEGEKFSEVNLWVKRPGTGDYLAEDYEFLLGKRAAEKITKGSQIKKSQVSS